MTDTEAELARLVEAVAELQLAAFLAGRGSVTSMQYGIRSAKPRPIMEEFRRLAATAIESGAYKDQPNDDHT